MKWVRDTSGRFPERPYYESEELDYECEALISSFLRTKYGTVAFPISTNDLTILLEQATSDLDLYADLAGEGDTVEGVTDFLPNREPRVRIARELSSDPRRENRLRTTLTHEFGHVKFHSFLWPHGQLALFENSVRNHSPRCKRETILGAGRVNWMEWQAGYASGAMLMPVTTLRQLVRASDVAADSTGPVAIASPRGQALVRQVQAQYQVSEDAARVRLLQLGILSDHPTASRQRNLL